MADFRVWKIEELRKLPPGTKFEHRLLGACHVEVIRGEKRMVFDEEKDASPLCFNRQDFPWSLPMRVKL